MKQILTAIWLMVAPISAAAEDCVVLLHGFTNDAHIWDGLASKLQQSHQVFALDFRGHGDSDWDPEGRYEHAVLVSDVQQIIAQLGLNNIHLVGHSLGARVAVHILG